MPFSKNDARSAQFRARSTADFLENNGKVPQYIIAPLYDHGKLINLGWEMTLVE